MRGVWYDVIRHFNPRLPHGRRLSYNDAARLVDTISIHASLTGGDMIGAVGNAKKDAISIHASLTGGDQY